MILFLIKSKIFWQVQEIYTMETNTELLIILKTVIFLLLQQIVFSNFHLLMQISLILHVSIEHVSYHFALESDTQIVLES